jgi:hypothetical protein
VSNLSQSTLEALAREYGPDPDAVDAHAESVQEDESGAERGAHLQRLQNQHGWTAERAAQFLRALDDPVAPRTDAPVGLIRWCASGHGPLRRGTTARGGRA